MSARITGPASSSRVSTNQISIIAGTTASATKTGRFRRSLSILLDLRRERCRFERSRSELGHVVSVYRFVVNRAQLGLMQNPVRGFLHGAAALVSIVALIALIARSQGVAMTAASTIYGVTLIVMYSTSALYHSVPWQSVWKSRFQILDHAFIYALVAGTFTPLLIGVGETFWIVLGLAGIWTLAALGLSKELVHFSVRRTLLPPQFLAVGVTLAPMWVTLRSIATPAAALTVAGGAAYLLGVLLFVNDRPRLAPRVFSHHEFFHVVVIIASALHFIAVWIVISSF